MRYEILDPDIDALIEQYPLSSLSARFIAASDLSEEMIGELLDNDTALHESHAPCIEAACRMIMEARQKGQKVFVAGDYDADGICATAIMKDMLDQLRIPNGYYIPNRFREGYGLSAATVKAAHAKGYSLIITVDNGVKCQEAINAAHALGMKIIVTDHHRMDEEIPADVLVHPELLEEEFQVLSGAGVALEISRKLLGNVPKHIALAAIAALGDVMPLWKENRRILRQGIAAISRNELQPVKVLFRDPDKINEDTIRFQVVPKINSVGRLSDRANVNSVVRYLLDSNPATIESYRVQLNRLNDLRRSLSSSMVEKARELMDDLPIAVIYDDSFHEGICGLAAGKLAETCSRPFIIFAKHDDILKGSGRSVPGFDLYAFLNEMDLFQEFGGHDLAVGLSMKESSLDALRQYISERIPKNSFGERENQRRAVRVNAEDLTLNQIMEFEGLRPFPTELITCCAVEDPEVISVNTYTRVTRARMRSMAGSYEGVYFSWQGIEWKNSPRYLFGMPEINRFRDRISVQLALESVE